MKQRDVPVLSRPRVGHRRRHSRSRAPALGRTRHTGAGPDRRDGARPGTGQHHRGHGHRDRTFWKNLELRTLAFDETRCDGLEIHSWAKFRPRAYFCDPWLDACRELITIDTAIFPAVAIALAGGRYAALSMDLYAAFHSPPPAEDFLLVTAQSTAAGAGLVSGIAQTRAADGTLTASGGSQLLCRMLGR
jgi:hypothetical protein